MTIGNFWISFLSVLNAMSPYLLLGFLIAGILHVFVPKRFYAKYLSRDNKLSVLWAALLGIPLPLCSCGVIPTAVGLKNEGASKGAVASFLIATPQTGIDSILATFSLMGLGFAIVRPVAALVTGICGGFLVNRFVKADESEYVPEASCKVEVGNRLWRVLKYAYFDMIQDIGLRLVIGLPVAAALMMKGLSPGAALVMLMAGPAVNIASILVVKKSMGSRFTWIYLLTIVGFSILFGLLINAFGINVVGMTESCGMHGACCHAEAATPSVFQIVCSSLLVLFIIIALGMKFFDQFKKQETEAGTVVYTVEGMHCNHCKAAVEQSVGKLKGVETCEATPAANTLVITGTASADDVRKAVEQAGFEFKGEK